MLPVQGRRSRCGGCRTKVLATIDQSFTSAVSANTYSNSLVHRPHPLFNVARKVGVAWGRGYISQGTRGGYQSAMARYILCADWVWRTGCGGLGVASHANNIIVHTRYRRQMLPSVPFACAVRLRGSLRAKAELHP